MPTQKFRRSDLAPPGPQQPGRFRFAHLSKVSGVAIGTIANWTSRRIFDRQPASDVKHRRFDFWDALHLPIIRDIASLRMQFFGRGAILSESLLTCAKCHVG